MATEQEIVALTRAIQVQSVTMQTLVESMAEIKPVVMELKDWKLVMVASVDELRDEVGELRQQVKVMAREATPARNAAEMPSLLPLPEHLKPKELKEEDDQGRRPNEVNDSIQNRVRIRENSTMEFSSGNGMYGLHPLPMPSIDEGNTGNRFQGAHHYHPSPPKLDFPEFDGDNPKAWKLRCEVYFRVCATRPELWIGVATMHFVGSVVLWLHATQAHTECMSWEEFAEAVCLRFGKEEFQQQPWHFNRLRQNGMVSDFVENFNDSMHHLLAHHTWDPMFFVT